MPGGDLGLLTPVSPNLFFFFSLLAFDIGLRLTFVPRLKE